MARTSLGSLSNQTVIDSDELRREIAARKKKDEDGRIAEANKARDAEIAREQWRDDIENLMRLPAFRRYVRFCLGDQCMNYLGENSDGRSSAVSLVNEMMKSEKRTLQILFSTQEDDENV